MRVDLVLYFFSTIRTISSTTGLCITFCQWKDVLKITIEISILLSAVSVAFAIYFGLKRVKRSEKLDIKSDTAQLTTVIVKLENIGIGIAEIKAELFNVKNDVKEDRERIIRLEESVKQAHKRIDGLEKK